MVNSQFWSFPHGFAGLDHLKDHLKNLFIHRLQTPLVCSFYYLLQYEFIGITRSSNFFWKNPNNKSNLSSIMSPIFPSKYHQIVTTINSWCYQPSEPYMSVGTIWRNRVTIIQVWSHQLEFSQKTDQWNMSHTNMHTIMARKLCHFSLVPMLKAAVREF